MKSMRFLLEEFPSRTPAIVFSLQIHCILSNKVVAEQLLYFSLDYYYYYYYYSIDAEAYFEQNHFLRWIK